MELKKSCTKIFYYGEFTVDAIFKKTIYIERETPNIYLGT